MSDAVVFSKTRQVVFAEPLTRRGLEGALIGFLIALGEPLSYEGIILGHIKLLARLPASEAFLFLSLTRLDQVDIKGSPDWEQIDDGGVGSIDLAINILIFGYSRSTVEKAVDDAVQKYLV
ncbi:hypothetical protein [Anaeroselena agilis]|uniref:Uncharacterized protein n=1 Tax=Anaeroselena agilis TaxID=3063788 RepID=A0ABU3P0J9_9FIRM|nr:hypothetical protein [Selenomonadales bacterium 4137-cl]